MFFIFDNHKGTNLPLIIQFFVDFADILASFKFRSWYGKHEANYPWMDYSYVVMIHDVVRS